MEPSNLQSKEYAGGLGGHLVGKVGHSLPSDPGRPSPSQASGHACSTGPNTAPQCRYTYNFWNWYFRKDNNMCLTSRFKEKPLSHPRIAEHHIPENFWLNWTHYISGKCCSAFKLIKLWVLRLRFWTLKEQRMTHTTQRRNWRCFFWWCQKLSGWHNHRSNTKSLSNTPILDQYTAILGQYNSDNCGGWWVTNNRNGGCN